MDPDLQHKKAATLLEKRTEERKKTHAPVISVSE
jgi:hypothetical protein